MKEQACNTLDGSYEESYQLLPYYCEQIESINPNSMAKLEYDPDTKKFERIFVSYGGSITGFTHCRPILGLDGTHLKGKYLGTLLCATAVDASGVLFPVAFGVINAENNDNWLWMLQHLRRIISLHAPIHLEKPSDLVIFLTARKA